MSESTALTDVTVPVLSCSRLEVGYQGRAILPPVDVTIAPGDLWFVVGRNGSGKTTWFRTILGLLPRVRGDVSLGIDPRSIAYIPQKSQYDALHPMRARDVVGLGIVRGWSFLKPQGRHHARIDAALNEAGAAHLAESSFGSLSEGQKQRVLLARLIAAEAKLALLDEPTAAMDIVAERETFEQLNQLRQRHGTALIVVSHHVRVVHEFAQHVLYLDGESQIALSGGAAEVLAHPQFTRRFGLPSAELARPDLSKEPNDA